MLLERDRGAGIGLVDVLLLAAVALLPWAYGGVETWAFRGAAFLIVFAATVAIWRVGARGLLPERGNVWLLPAGLLAVWGAAQLLPLPPSAVRVLSPRAYEIQANNLPGYAAPAPERPVAYLADVANRRLPDELPPPPETSAAPTIDPDWPSRPGRWRPLSLLPPMTAERLAWYFALLVAFMLARRQTEDAERARVYRRVLFAGFIALASFGLLQKAGWNGKLFWVRDVPPQSLPFGPYVNGAHFGAVMELAVPWMAGVTLARVRRGADQSWRTTLPLLAGGAVLCFVAGLATSSKAAAGLLVLSSSVVLLMSIRNVRLRLLGLAALVAVWVGAGFLLLRSGLAERFVALVDTMGDTFSGAGRLAIVRTSWGIFSDFWLTGAGYGSFREIAPAYLPPGEFGRWLQLHNDYLEVLLEGGLIGAVLVLWLVLGFGVRAASSCRRGNGSLDLGHVGACVGLASLCAHALVDFNHQIPANALLFVTIAAIVAARGERLRGGR